MKNTKSIGITSLAYNFPKLKISIDDLEKKGKLSSSSKTLKDFGFKYAHICKDENIFNSLMLKTAKSVLATSEIKKEDIDLLFLYRGIEYNKKEEKADLSVFKYNSAKLNYDLRLKKASSFAISEQGCSGVLSAIDLAFHYINSSDKKSILCLTGDMLNPLSKREIIYNIMSDSTSGFIIKENSPENIIKSFHQITHSYYWDTPLREQEVLAAYFPMAKQTITEALKKANLTINDVSWFVPHNVNLKSWQILSKLLGIPETKIWTKNISKYGHTVSCDHIVNLFDMEKLKLLKKGDILVLFTFGFGASWSCLIIEH
ncbi:MAG: 3-oxoacyl-[acyl-carrier-protein] synthase III C-terminal domain-containing protein [Candidatus Pacearchaeota archaeon]